MILFKYIFIILFFFTSLFADLFFTEMEENFIENNKKIIVGGETDWAPYDYVKDGEYKGVAREFLELISKKTGLEFEYKTGYTWNELLKLAKNKQIDVLPILAKTSNREKFLLFTDKYLSTRQYVFTLFNNKTIKNENDLRNKKIAIVKGYAGTELFSRKYPSLVIVESENLLDSIDKLITKEVDLLIENTGIINHLLRENNIMGIKPKFSINLKTDFLHMGIRDDMPILRDILQKALLSITEDEKNKILNKWLNLKFESRNFLSKDELEYIKRNKKLIVANEFDWIPLDFYENNMPRGYSIDFMKLIAKKSGLDLRFKTDNWDNLWNEFIEGEIDILPVISKNEKREKYMYFSDKYFSQTPVIVTSIDNIDIKSIDDLKGKTLALNKGWNITNLIEKYYKDINIIYADDVKDKFESVIYGKADATIDSFMISNYYLQNSYINNLKITNGVNIPEYKGDFHIGIKKGNKKLLSIINKSMSQISSDELRELNRKWQAKDKKSVSLTIKEQEFIDKNIINIVATNKWAPFNYIDENDEIRGIANDYWELVSQKTGIKYSPSLIDSFSTVLNSIKEKKEDVIFGTGETKERKEYAIFSNTYQSFPISIATLKSEKYIPNVLGLVNKKIAVVKNFTAHKILEKNNPNLDFLFVKDISEALEFVSDGKAYAAVDIVPTLVYYINKNGFTNIKISGHTGYNFDMKFMIRSDYKDLQNIINKAIDKISLDEKQLIHNRWLAVKYDKGFDYSLFWKVLVVFIIIVVVIVFRNRQLIKYQKIIEKKNKILQKQSMDLEKSNSMLEDAKNNLESSLVNFKALVDSTIESLIIIEKNKILYINNEMLKLFDIDKKSNVIGIDIRELFFISSIDKLEEIILSANGEVSEIFARKNNNDKFPVLIKVKKLVYEGKNTKIISLIDLTDLKRKEQLIQEQSKMVAIGEMIGNIAHQWRQPLSIISTAASGTKFYNEMKMLDDNRLDESMDIIVENSKFLSQTIDDFRDFIKDDKVVNSFIIDKVIEKTLSLLSASFNNNYVKLELELLCDIEIKSYENELIQALMNILNNSKDALIENDNKDKIIRIKSYIKDKNIVIDIQDSAGGIKEEIIQNIFEPYFTTKHKSLGTGLGLYMSHKIVYESLRGFIEVENKSFEYNRKSLRGANFKIIIPFNN